MRDIMLKCFVLTLGVRLALVNFYRTSLREECRCQVPENTSEQLLIKETGVTPENYRYIFTVMVTNLLFHKELIGRFSNNGREYRTRDPRKE